MSSRIEQLIDEIEEYIDNCKYQPLSNSKIIVNKDEIDDLLRELRQKTPEEIKRYQKIISNKEAILNDAREKAQALINEATEHTTELINEHEIMQQAYAQSDAAFRSTSKCPLPVFPLRCRGFQPLHADRRAGRRLPVQKQQDAARRIYPAGWTESFFL